MFLFRQRLQSNQASNADNHCSTRTIAEFLRRQLASIDVHQGIYPEHAWV
jgi:hypothetical protein